MTPAQDEIIVLVAWKHKVRPDEILSDGRGKRVSHARQEVMWRMRQDGRWTTTQIGRALGRDHTTVIFGAAAHEQRAAADVQRWSNLGTGATVHSLSTDAPGGPQVMPEHPIEQAATHLMVST